MRETLLKAAAWRAVMLLASFLNVFAILPQAWNVWHSRDMHVVSVPMFICFLFIQVAFCIDGWARKNWFLCLSLGGASIGSILVLTRIGGLYFNLF